MAKRKSRIALLRIEWKRQQSRMLDALAGATILTKAANKIHDTDRAAEYERLKAAFRAVLRLALARSRFLWQVADGEIDADLLLPRDGADDVAGRGRTARRQRKSWQRKPRVSVQGG